MKKLLIAAFLCSISFSAFAAEEAINQTRNIAGTTALTIFNPKPTANAILVYDIASNLGRTDGGTGSFKYAPVSTGLCYSGGNVSVCNIPMSSITGLNDALDHKQDQSPNLDILAGMMLTPNVIDLLGSDDYADFVDKLDLDDEFQPLSSKLTEYSSFTLGNGEFLTRDASGILQGATITDIGASVMAAADSTAMKSIVFSGGSASNIVLGDGTTSPVSSFVTSGTLSDYVPTTRTVNGHALSANVTVTASDVGAAATSHTHAAADIVSGTLADARVAQSNVTQHQAALTLSESQVTSLTTDLAAKQAALTLTTTGTGAATLVGSTLNIPTPAGAAVSSVFGRTGAVTAQSGDYTTAQVTESGNLYFTNARAISAPIPGYTSGAGTVAAADSVLQAIQKLNGNDALKAPLSGATFTGAISATNLSGTNTGDQTTITGNAGTATALAANGTNCSAGQYARGVDASGNAENCTAIGTRTFNHPSRTLASCFLISATNDADFHYGVDSGTVLALGTLTGAVTSYTNSGCTTGAQVENDGSIVGLAIGQGQTLQLNGTIPAGRWAKITGATTGLGNAASIRTAQTEVVLP